MTSPPSPDLRSRWLLPPALVTALALVVSVGVHVPAYFGLGMLEHLLEDRPAAPSAPMEIEIVESESVAPRDPEEAEPVEPDPVEEAPPERRARREERAAEAREAPVEEEREREPQVQAAAQPVTPPEARPEPRRRTSVEHRSQDPNVEPPPDAEYLAEENSRVEEETMARIRNPNRNDPEPQAPSPTEPTPAADDEGDAAEELMEELAEREGSDERDPTPEETVDPPEPRRPHPPTRSETPSVAEAARGDGRSGGDEGDGAPREAAGGGRQARGGGDRPMREVVVSDGVGSFVIRVPVERPEGSGEGEGGGPAVAGRGAGNEGEGRGSGRAGRGHRRQRGGARGGRGAPSLRLSWSQFASVYGEEELERQREAYLEQRRSRVRGASRQERWQRFRAAIENYDVRVRPGNQTALNTRADPFAAFIAAMHRRIHPRFAGGYLTRVPSTVEQTFRMNQDMHTKLELAIDSEGRVDRVGVVGTSGDMLFDLGAYESVMGAQPFPAPPSNIQSPDGLVYMHWSFYRNHRQCGTFNAEAYILAEAPSGGRGGGETGDALMDRGSVFRPGREEEPEADGPAAAEGSDADRDER